MMTTTTTQAISGWEKEIEYNNKTDEGKIIISSEISTIKFTNRSANNRIIWKLRHEKKMLKKEIAAHGFDCLSLSQQQQQQTYQYQLTQE